MFLLSTHLFFIFVSSFSIWFFSFPAFFLSLRCFSVGHARCHGSFNWLILYISWLTLVHYSSPLFDSISQPYTSRETSYIYVSTLFFIFVSCFLYMLSYFPAFFLVLLSKPQNTSLILISLDWFCIINYTLFSSDCFMMQPRWNHDETMMTYTEDMTHVTTPWLDRFCIFYAPAFTVIAFLTNTTFLLFFIFFDCVYFSFSYVGDFFLFIFFLSKQTHL